MGKNTEDYIWAIQHAHSLLCADHAVGALACLPAGGIDCETLVEKAVSILRNVLDEEDVPARDTAIAEVQRVLADAEAQELNRNHGN